MPNSLKKIFVIIVLCFTWLSGYSQWNTDRILTIGRNALYFEDYVLSIQYFNQVIKLKPYLAEPYMYRAMAKIQLGDDQGAEDDANLAIDRNPFLPQAYYIRGFARRNLDNLKGALEDFTKAYHFSPNNSYLLLNRMDVYMRMKDFKKAMADLDTYMKQDPNSNNMYYEKGIILLSMNDTIGAENAMKTFIKHDSTESMGWSALGLIKMQKKDIKGAYADYTKAIDCNSIYPGDYVNRGILNVQLKNYRQALKDYDQAIHLDDQCNLAYFNRGILRDNLGDKNNALDDYNKVLELDSTNTNALYRRAILENELGILHNAIKDFNKILDKHPYFIPALWGIAESQDKLGNKKEAFIYRKKAYDIEKNKDKIKKEIEAQLAENNKIDKETQKSATNRKTEMFNRYIAENIDDDQSKSKYKDVLRGDVQNRYADVINQRNFVLSYYAKEEKIRRTNLFQPLVEKYNHSNILNAPLKITNSEIPLTSAMVNQHFEAISEISDQISIDGANADLYFKRALEFGLVKDFNSAIDDLNKALSLRPNFVLAYFCRANIRYKLVEYMKNTQQENNKINLKESFNSSPQKVTDTEKYKLNSEMIMRDYDKVIELAPGFSFAYYNKANILCTQNNFRTAISYYTKAITCDNDFAEAYFNRGLTYLFIGENQKGLNDLSKAGELGIYQSYNLLKRFKEN